MDFKGFYDEIIFDVDKSILKSYTGKQGDTKSRGLYVTVTQKNAVIDDLTGLSMRLFYEKPDKTRGFIDGVVDGSKFRIDYTNQMYAVPGVVKAELRLMGADGEIITAKTFKILVDSSIADGSIVSENERGILDRAFELAEDIIPRIELLDVELLEDVQNRMINLEDQVSDIQDDLQQHKQDYLSHKNDFTTYRDSNNLKVAKVEKELSDYKSTMQQLNPNQEPKQTASDYGVVSLPKNAANGQVSVSIFGNTETDVEGNTKSTIGAVRIKSVGKNLVDLRNVSVFKQSDNCVITVDEGRNVWKIQYAFANLRDKVLFDNFLPNRQYMVRSVGKRASANALYGVLVYTDGSTVNIPLQGIGNYAEMISFSDPTKNLREIRIGASSDEISYLDLDSFMIAETTNSTPIPYEPYRESNAYIVATDKDTGKILELRSLPNGTKDEIRVSEGKAIINTKKHILQTSDINYLFLEQEVDVVRILLPTDCKDVVDSIQSVIYGNKKFIPYISRLDVSNVGAYSLLNAHGYNFLFLTVAKGTYATLAEAQSDLAGTELIYQLAESVEIPIEVSGSLVSHPNGTVYVEPVVADAGVYADKMEVLHEDLPIKAIDKLSKVDFMTGVETELDISQAEISEDKLSFTHPELNAGDIVFFEYEYDVESTDGEAEVEFYDSRYVVKDTETGKFYKWNIVVANGQPSIELVEV